MISPLGNEIAFFSKMCNRCGEPKHPEQRCVLKRRVRPLKCRVAKCKRLDLKWYGHAPTKAAKRKWRPKEVVF